MPKKTFTINEDGGISQKNEAHPSEIALQKQVTKATDSQQKVAKAKTNKSSK